MGEFLRAGWLAKVNRRLRRTQRDGSPKHVLNRSAALEAEALLDNIGWSAAGDGRPPDIEAQRAAGWLFWLRWLALPDGQGEEELDLAVRLLGPVFGADPESVPEPVRDLFLLLDAPADDDPATLADDGPATLAGAVALRRSALRAAPRELRASLLNDQGVDLRRLFLMTGNGAALQEAVAALRAAVHFAPGQAMYLTNLGTVLNITFDQTGDQAALNEAVEVGRAAVTAMSADDPGRPVHLSGLALSLQSRYGATGRLELITEAADLLRAALEATPDTDPGRAADLGNLGNTLHLIFGHTGDAQVLAEAITTSRAAVAAAPASGPTRAGALANLSAALQSRYRLTGDLQALTDAVTAGRDAVEATADQFRHLTVLGNALRTLFERNGDLDTLTEAVAVLRAGLAATAPGGFHHGALLTNLCGALAVTYQRTGDPDALGEAVAVARAAVDATPAGHPNLGGYQSNLAAALTSLAEHTGDQEAADEAIAVGRAAVDALPPYRADLAHARTNLGKALKLRFDRTGDLETLAEAIAIIRAAVAAEHNPDRASDLANLGVLLQLMFERSGDAEIRAEERKVLAEAVSAITSPASVRIMAGRGLARAGGAAGDDQSVLEAMEAVVALLPRLAARDLRRADREYRLGSEAGIAPQAAAAALSVGRPRRALELLEQARGLLLAEAINDRTAPESLARHAPDLLTRFERLRDRFAALDTAPPERRPPAVILHFVPTGSARSRQGEEGQLADQRRAAAAEWEELLGVIRARPGLEGFLLPPSAEELQRRVGRGPIVVVTAAVHRGDALILTTSPGQPVLHVPLPGLTHEQVQRQVALDDLPTVLEWLWDTVAEPVLAALNHTRTPGPDETWPRLWWCPVGIISYLPLHAAGHHQDATAGLAHPRTVLDRVVSSYTATIQALAATPKTVRSPDRPALVVSMPVTRGARMLPGVAAETKDLKRLLPGVTVLTGSAATHAAVRDALPRYGVAHFACHGLSDWSDPAGSRLLLYDHATDPFTVAAISRLQLADAGLAYLSACSTTDTSPRLTDEAVHITAAFQLAGYRHVVGTLWPVDDQAARRIAADVYRQIVERGGPAALDTGFTPYALHHALRRLRAESPDSPAHWAAHIHVGN